MLAFLRRPVGVLAVLVVAALSTTLVGAQAATTAELRVSTSADRSNSAPLDGATLSGNAYVFSVPETGVTEVRFWLDNPSRTGTPNRIEAGAPFDYAGSAKSGAANPLNTANLSNGQHTITISVKYASGLTEVVTATFTVDNAPPPTPELRVSSSSSRSEARPLGGATLESNAYIFALPETGVTSVKFWLDDPTRAGTPNKTEVGAPFDFAGTATNGSALPFGTRSLANGQHTMTILTTFATGATRVVTETFTVDNQPPQARLRVSQSPDRSASQDLNGATLSGSVYIFSLPEDEVDQVSFWIDDPSMVGPARTTEGVAPFDFAGSASGGAPNRFRTRTMPNGQHTITAAVSYEGGLTQVVTATFTIDNVRDCSPLSCSELLVDLPYNLDFAADRGKIPDANGVGTGFTAIDPPSESPGYIPANIVLDRGAGNLLLTTTSGIAYLEGNNQDNALSVGIDAPNQIAHVNATIVNPPAGTGSYEQGGVWFGNDEENYDKLDIVSTPTGTRIEHLQEVQGVRTKSAQSAVIDLTSASVTLNLKVDPFNRTITGSYRLNGGTAKTIGTFAAPGEFFSFDAAGIDPAIGTRSFGGIFATHRNGPAPLTYTFAEFGVDKEAPVGAAAADIQFDRTSFPVSFPTSIDRGPDGKLYVTELFGKIHKVTLDADGQVVQDQVITTLGTRLTLGLTVDPQSTPDNVIVWASHSSPSLNDGVPNSGTVTKLSGPNLATRTDVITGLPRAKANHAINSIHFGPDGRLYIAQGGNTGAGAPNSANTEFGTMEEQPLSAALLVADVRNAAFDGSCANPTDIFGPPPCDVQVFASGLRNTYDFTFHSNGFIYGPDNGLGVVGTFPPSPTAPCFGMGDPTIYTQGGDNPGEQSDSLNLIEQGRFYGHPNPYRDECVFRDGRYQSVGAPANYSPPIHNLGNNRSANGIIEYKSNAFCAAARGELLIANYSVGDNIVRHRLASDGRSVTSAGNFVGGFTDPLPLAQGPGGEIYVGEQGAGRVTVLKPLATGCWSTKNPMPQALLDIGGTALGGKLYVVAGKSTSSNYHSTVRVYDPVTDSWSTVANLPGPAVENPAVTAMDGKLYVFGGSASPFAGSVKNAAVFDPGTGSWSVLPPMPTGRGGATAQALGGKLYVAGGMDEGASVASVDVFDPATGAWSSVATMETRRDNSGSAVLDGRMYVFGGRTRNADGTTVNGALASVEMFDPVTGVWVPRRSMPSGRRTMVVGTLGGQAQVMGGEGATTSPGTFPQNEQYDPATDTWRTLKAVPTPRHGAAAGTIGDTVYVVGGGPVGGASFSTVNEAFTFRNPD